MNINNYKKLHNAIPIVSYQIYNDESSLNVESKNLVLVLSYLKKHVNTQFSMLSCISGVDLLFTNYRFCVAYDLLSLTNNARIRVKCFVNEVTYLDSSCIVYKNANWWEREIWDMYGIYFQNHPDLRRILTDYGFEGYPLRKDFPLSGYAEVSYDSSKKRVVLEPVEFAQEYRYFAYEGPWTN
jgi:NADH dehydrogenase (ubiquinone) Fe-S protein 3